MNHFPFTVLGFFLSSQKGNVEMEKGKRNWVKISFGAFLFCLLFLNIADFMNRERWQKSEEEMKKPANLLSRSASLLFLHRFHSPKRWLARVNTITHHRRAIVCSTQTCYCPHFNIFTINFSAQRTSILCAVDIFAAAVVVIVAVDAFPFFSHPLLISIISSTLL